MLTCCNNSRDCIGYIQKHLFKSTKLQFNFIFVVVSIVILKFVVPKLKPEMFCVLVIGMTISAAFSLVLEEQVEVEEITLVSFIHVLHVRVFLLEVSGITHKHSND